MADKPEERARAEIDRLLAAAGWSVQSMSEANIHAARGVVIALPQHAEQRRIVAEVDRRLSLARVVESEIDANLKREKGLRQSILNQTFSGQALGSGRSVAAADVRLMSESA